VGRQFSHRNVWDCFRLAPWWCCEGCFACIIQTESRSPIPLRSIIVNPPHGSIHLVKMGLNSTISTCHDPGPPPVEHDIDVEYKQILSPMAERDFQDFSPPEGLCQPLSYPPAALYPSAERADTPKIWDSQLQSSLLLDCLSPFHDKVWFGSIVPVIYDHTACTDDNVGWHS